MPSYSICTREHTGAFEGERELQVADCGGRDIKEHDGDQDGAMARVTGATMSGPVMGIRSILSHWGRAHALAMYGARSCARSTE